MADKKRHKEKDRKKDKKKDREEKKKKKKQSSQSDDSDSDDSSSPSSKSNSKSKRQRKQKKIKKSKKSKKESPAPKEPAPTNNTPYDFSSVVPTNYPPTTIPGIKGMPIPVIPPPLPSATNTSSVPKPKTKEPNIFKLLPKLHYGAVQFAKTIYSGEYIGDNCLDKLLILMAKNIESTVKEQAHKKGMAQIAKCIAELQKNMNEQREEKSKNESRELFKEKNSRYEQLERIYKQSLRNL